MQYRPCTTVLYVMGLIDAMSAVGFIDVSYTTYGLTADAILSEYCLIFSLIHYDLVHHISQFDPGAFG